MITSRPTLHDRSDIAKITATMLERMSDHYKGQLSTRTIYHDPLDCAVARPTSSECGELNPFMHHGYKMLCMSPSARTLVLSMSQNEGVTRYCSHGRRDFGSGACPMVLCSRTPTRR